MTPTTGMTRTATLNTYYVYAIPRKGITCPPPVTVPLEISRASTMYEAVNRAMIQHGVFQDSGRFDIMALDKPLNDVPLPMIHRG